MNIYGAVVVNGVEYEDNEIADIIKDQPHTPLKYGVNWDYLGDAGIEESNICVTWGTGRAEREVFDGETGLNDFIAFLQKRSLS